MEFQRKNRRKVRAIKESNQNTQRKCDLRTKHLLFALLLNATSLQFRILRGRTNKKCFSPISMFHCSLSMLKRIIKQKHFPINVITINQCKRVYHLITFKKKFCYYMLNFFKRKKVDKLLRKYFPLVCFILRELITIQSFHLKIRFYLFCNSEIVFQLNVMKIL